MSQKKFWMWRNQADAGGEKGEADSGGARELELYGTIAEESWFDDDITPAMFKEELFAGSGPITVWINSPGGDCIAASQIYTMLMDYKGDVTVKIDGIAASAASVIAMAGTEVLMAPTALIMIHNPAYEIKTSLSRDKLSKLMDAETWMNANKAVELGFADGVMEDEKTVAEIPAYAFSRKTVQAALMNKIATVSRKERVREEQACMIESRAEKLALDAAFPVNVPEAVASEEKVTVEPAGRSVDELKARLVTIKDFI